MALGYAAAALFVSCAFILVLCAIIIDAVNKNTPPSSASKDYAMGFLFFSIAGILGSFGLAYVAFNDAKKDVVSP